MDRVLIVGDAQAPYYHKPSLSILKQFAKDFQPNYFVDLGDRWDFRSLSKFEPDNEKAQLKLRFIEDKQAGIDWGDSIHKSLPKRCKKVFLKGNHEERCKKFIKEQSVLDGLIEIETYLKENNYTIIEHGHYTSIGKLYFNHGDEFGGVNHSRTYALRTGKNVIYGHHHSFQSTTVHHLDQPHAAFSIGMMGDREQLRFYTEGKPLSWQNGFAYAYILPSGRFALYPVIVTDNSAIIEGRIYNGAVPH